MGKNWLVAGGLIAFGGVAQGADIEIFGIHTPNVGKWAVYARMTNVNGAAGISSISVDLAHNDVNGVGRSAVTLANVKLPSGVSRYTDTEMWPEFTGGVGYGFWVPGLRHNGDLDSEGIKGVSAAQYTVYDRQNAAVPYKELVLPGIGVTAGSALKNDTTGGPFATTAGHWGYPILVASGDYTPASLTGAGAAQGVKIGFSDALNSVNVLRWNATKQDYDLESARQLRVIDARNYTLGAANASDATTVYARGGDADLNGAVEFADLLLLAKNYSKPGAAWFQGDFDYNQIVDFADLLLLAKNYGKPAPSSVEFSEPFEQAVAAAFAQVPEPGVAGLILVGLLGLSGRRQRNKKMVESVRIV